MDKILICRSTVQLHNSLLEHLNLKMKWLKEWKRYNSEKSEELGTLYHTPNTIFWIILSGNAVTEFNGVRYELQAGDIISLPSDMPYRWLSIAKDAPLHQLALACDAKVGSLDLLRIYPLPYLTHVRNSEIFQRCVTIWYTLSELFSRSNENMEPSKNNGKYSSMFFLDFHQTKQHFHSMALGIEWFQILFNMYPEESIPPSVAYDTRVFQLCTFIRQNLHHPLTLDQLASAANLSKTQLRTLFIQQLGTTPMRYVLKLRMQQARELLMFTTYPVGQISELLGYDRQHNFTRTFHSIEGMSPTQFRQRSKLM